MIKLICFDLDGVLIDACEWHYLALNRALKEIAGFEISRDDHELTFNGLPTKEKLDYLVAFDKISQEQVKEIAALKQEYTLNIIRDNAKLDKEKCRMLNLMQVLHGFKFACVTNSIRRTAQVMLGNTGQLSYMDMLIHNECVRFPKPHAEPYIKAMVLMQCLPEETIIVEDSEIGLRSAKATGAYIWQVKDSSEVTWENFEKFYKTLQ